MSATENEFRPKMPQDALGGVRTGNGGLRGQRDGVAAIIRAVTAHYGIPLQIFMSKNRTQHVADARAIAMVLAAELFPRLTAGDLMREFNRSGSDLWHARKRVQARVDVDRKFCEEIEALRASVNHQRRTGVPVVA